MLGAGATQLQPADLLRASPGLDPGGVDSGGTLNGALLHAGLVDEVSILLDPTLIGGTTPSSLYVAPDLPSEEGGIRLRPTHVETLRGGNVWLRYEVVR